MKNITYIENVNKWMDSFHFYCPIKVRFGETDAFGHLNNANAFVYFEEARIEFLKELGFIQVWINENNDTRSVVANIQCDYIKQVYFDEKLKVYVKINDVGNSSFELHYMVRNEKNEVCLTGRNTIVQISKKTGRAISLSAEMKEKMKR
jgi:acyl-CoA thioester hydrolase